MLFNQTPKLELKWYSFFGTHSIHALLHQPKKHDQLPRCTYYTLQINKELETNLLVNSQSLGQFCQDISFGINLVFQTLLLESKILSETKQNWGEPSHQITTECKDNLEFYE